MMRTRYALLVGLLAGFGALSLSHAAAAGRPWRNVLRNPGFEQVDAKGVPVGWRWSAGRAKATMTVDDAVAHSGKRSVKLVNPTARSPHVYGSLTQQQWVRPGRPYVLTCYVRSQAAGTMWIGGGARWQHRFAFPAKAEGWTRVVGRFTTAPDERRFRVMVVTESPTKGVWVDDVMLEEGTEPTEFVMDRPLTAGQAALTVEPMDLGENLLPNSSFETVHGNRPQHWAFDRRNTDATLAIDDQVAHSGQRSLHITNSTRFGPHVYGMCMLVGGLAVKPGTPYTISAYVRSDDPGVAWIGGAARWRVRCKFPRTYGQWRRVSSSFVTGKDETSIPIMIITESPTKGFWVDDVKLEEGNYASPYVAPEAPDAIGLDLAVRPPQPVMSRRGLVVPIWAPSKYPPATSAFVHRELWVDGALLLPQGVPAATVTMRAVNPAGKTLCEAVHKGDLAAGALAVTFGWEAFAVAERKLRFQCVVVDGQGREVVSRTLKVDVYTGGQVEAELKKVEALRAELTRRIEQLRPRGLESRALATATVLANFVPWARLDVGGGDVGRAYEAALDMQRIGQARIAECDAVLAGKHPGWHAVRYRTSPIRIDGPSFVAQAVDSRTSKTASRPVFFSGYGHFGAVRRDIEKFPAYGANFIQIEFGPRSVLVAEDKTSDAAINAFLAVCDRAAKAGVSVNLLLSPHYFPDWAYKKWPHLADFKGGFLKHDINAPESRAVIEKSLRYVIPRIKGHAAIHSLCLSNEPVCVDITKSAASRTLWHQWLRAKYKTVDALNKAWDTGHKRFEDVAVEATFTGKPACYDFVCFNQEQFAAWHRWMADIIHEAWPGVPVHAKIMMSAHWGRHPHGIWSVSPELFGRLSQIHGNDCCKWYSHPQHPSAQGRASGWAGENMAYDFQRSMGDKPVFNSENHLIIDRDLDVIPPEHIYNVMWQGAIHGMSASTTWVWERTTDSASDAAGSIMHRPACTEAQNLSTLDLNRLAPQATALQRLAPKAVLLSSLASNIYDRDHVRVMREAYTALNFCGISLGFVTERQLAAWMAGGDKPFPLREAKVLVVPQASAVPDATMAGVARFAAEGGRVVRIGTCFARTEHNRPRALGGELAGEAWPEAEAKALWPKFRTLLSAAGIVPLAEVCGEDGKPAWGIELRAARVGGKLLVNLANYLRMPQRVRLMVGGRAAGGTDLISLRKTHDVFSVPSLRPMLIAVGR